MPTDTEKQEFIEGFIAAEGALKKYGVNPNFCGKLNFC